LAVASAIGFVYCRAFYGESWKAVVMAGSTALVIGVTHEILHGHYRRLLARGSSTPALLTRLIIASLLAGVVTTAIAASLDPLLHLDATAQRTWGHMAGCILITTFFHVAWSVLYVALKHKAEAQGANDRLREVRALATEAELAMLRYQLNPHFLFNSLTSLRQQIVEDAEKARTMTGELAVYLRHTLRDSAQVETTLGEELRATESYLALEKMRFEERLDVCFEIDPEARDCLVPSFLLQPLVENAIKYGKSGPKEQPLRLHIAARVEPGALHLAVGNSGAWRDAPSRPEGGIGLSNLRRRLEALYPGRHALAVGAEGTDWVCARIAILSPSGAARSRRVA
jgi:LytS/YehU family sensor histidine kinase